MQGQQQLRQGVCMAGTHLISSRVFSTSDFCFSRVLSLAMVASLTLATLAASACTPHDTVNLTSLHRHCHNTITVCDTANMTLLYCHCQNTITVCDTANMTLLYCHFQITIMVCDAVNITSLNIHCHNSIMVCVVSMTLWHAAVCLSPVSHAIVKLLILHSHC